MTVNLEHMIQSVDTLKNMGIRVLEQSPNLLKVEMPLEGNRNHLGGIYAGAIFSLAEFPFGMMCVLKFGLQNLVPVVGEVTIRYLAPAIQPLIVELKVTDQEWEEMERETGIHGKFKIAREIEVRDVSGKAIAMVKATYFMVKLPK